MDNPTEAQKGFGGTSMWMVYSAFLSGLSIYITVGSFISVSYTHLGIVFCGISS